MNRRNSAEEQDRQARTDLAAEVDAIVKGLSPEGVKRWPRSTR